ncbi:unnamed protein product, partial [Rotaria magnacalcarata]
MNLLLHLQHPFLPSFTNESFEHWQLIFEYLTTDPLNIARQSSSVKSPVKLVAGPAYSTNV